MLSSSSAALVFFAFPAPPLEILSATPKRRTLYSLLAAWRFIRQMDRSATVTFWVRFLAVLQDEGRRISLSFHVCAVDGVVLVLVSEGGFAVEEEWGGKRRRRRGRIQRSQCPLEMMIFAPNPNFASYNPEHFYL